MDDRLCLRERMKIWRQDAHLMASRFSDYRMTASQALSIILIQGGLYALNYQFRWIPVPMMMNLSLLALPLVLRVLMAPRTA